MSFVSKDDLSAILTNLNTKLRKKPTAVELTTTQYNALSSAEKHDTSKIYYLTDGQGGYTLPIASASTLGGIKVGSGLSIDNTGVLSSAASGGGIEEIPLSTNLFGKDTLSDYGFDSLDVQSTITFTEILNNYSALIFTISRCNSKPSGSDQLSAQYTNFVPLYSSLSSKTSGEIMRIQNLYDTNEYFPVSSTQDKLTFMERKRDIMMNFRNSEQYNYLSLTMYCRFYDSQPYTFNTQASQAFTINTYRLRTGSMDPNRWFTFHVYGFKK